MTPAQTRHYIKEAIKSQGGPEKMARKIDVQVGHIQAVYDGKHPGPKTMQALGLRRDAAGEYHLVK